MKGIGAVVLILIGLAILGSVFVTTNMFKSSKDMQTNPYQNEDSGMKVNETVVQPITDIASNATSHFPVNDLVDMLWSGTTGVMRYFVNYLILPISNTIGSGIASYAAGHQVSLSLPSWIGYILFVLLVLLIIWRYKDRIWEFTTNNLLIALIFIIAIIAIGIMLAYMKVI